MAKFTNRFLAGLQLEAGRKDRLVFDSECRGLGVRVTPKARTFIVQWTDPATKRKVREPIGIWGNITVDQARIAARVRLGAVATGINPRAERLRLRQEADRERAEAALSLDALVEEWAVLHLALRRERYRTEAIRAIRHAFPALLKRPAARITRADAVNALDGLVMAGKASMAGRTLAYARAAFHWAQKRGKVPHNPFQGLPISTSTAARERLLSDGEIAEVWVAANTLGYPFGPFFKLATLTMQRREEVAGMRWSEIADDLSLWTLPGLRMKSGRPHDVHLSHRAQEVLRSLPRTEGCDYVFSTTGRTPISGISKAKLALDAAIAGARAEIAKSIDAKPVPLVPWRIHDLRRSGVSVLARLGFDSIVVDKLLAHQPAKLLGVAAIYQRHDFARERGAALDAWAAHVTGTLAENVVPLRGASGSLAAGIGRSAETRGHRTALSLP
jgi:integrase